MIVMFLLTCASFTYVMKTIANDVNDLVAYTKFENRTRQKQDFEEEEINVTESYSSTLA